MRLGRVTQASPLRVQLNGDSADAPADGPAGFTVGAEVVVENVEGRRVVVYPATAQPGDSGWTTPALINGHVHYQGTATDSSDLYAPVQFRRMADGMVHMRGLVNSVSRTTPHALTLPVGYRPARHLIFAGWSNSGVYEFRVHNGGDVQVYLATAWASLACSWYAEL